MKSQQHLSFVLISQTKQEVGIVAEISMRTCTNQAQFENDVNKTFIPRSQGDGEYQFLIPGL